MNTPKCQENQKRMSNLPKKKWVVYLIQTTSGKIYTGITNNLERRFAAHQKNKGARFFRISSPEKVVKIEYFANRSEATKREIAIKKMSRSEKLQLVASVHCVDHSNCLIFP